MNELYVGSVVKSFDTNSVLTDIFISCKPGDIVGLLGRNGSGKSTLLHKRNQYSRRIAVLGIFARLQIGINS